MVMRVFKTRVSSAIMAVVLVTGITVAGAVTASPAGAATAGSALAPCTTPLFGADKDCESTSPTVDRWVTFQSGAQSCTYTQFVDWGDGTSSSRTFVDPVPALYLIASHKYGAESRNTTYTETVTSSVDSGNCKAIATTVFKFTHLLSAVAPWHFEYPFLNACFLSMSAEIGVGAAELVAMVKVPSAAAEIAGLFFFPETALILLVHKNCLEEPTTELSVLPSAFAYGVSHPGKQFKPAGKVPARPQITGVDAYQKGSLVYFSLSYADPGHDAKGFGFVGINGARWTLENHPFSSPSYGIVGHDRIDYPFNLGCGTAHQLNSYVEAWIYDSQGIRSNPVEVALTCTT